MNIENWMTLTLALLIVPRQSLRPEVDGKLVDFVMDDYDDEVQP